MPAFAVKHLVAEHGPVMANVKNIRKTPYSYTSKHYEAEESAKGNYIYVIEVHRSGGETSYAIAYKYRATESFKKPGSLWKDEFVYKNSATPGVKADGFYLEHPVLVSDLEFNYWFLSLPPGMAEIPSHLLPALDAVFENSSNGAKRFT